MEWLPGEIVKLLPAGSLFTDGISDVSPGVNPKL